MCKSNCQPRPCEHCWCQLLPGNAAVYPHLVCCKCGDRRAAGGPYWSVLDTMIHVPSVWLWPPVPTCTATTTNGTDWVASALPHHNSAAAAL